MKVLAIDHGTVRSGLAVSDPSGTIARPLSVIERIDSPAGQRRLMRIISDEAPEHIVVGEPRLMSGNTGAQARLATAFAERLRRSVSVPVSMVDERLTTSEATRRRNEAGGRKGKGPGIDALAACVMLDAFLRKVSDERP